VVVQTAQCVWVPWCGVTLPRPGRAVAMMAAAAA
jgi:hypothetical protein